jgi:hypothetical protein
MVPLDQICFDEEAAFPWLIVDAKRGVGSFLILELLDVAKEMKWTLWVYLCDWSLSKEGKDLLSSENTDTRAYQHHLAVLRGEELVRFSASDDGQECTFYFSGDVELILDDASDIYGKRQDLFKLYRGDSHYLSFVSGAGLGFVEKFHDLNRK